MTSLITNYVVCYKLPTLNVCRHVQRWVKKWHHFCIWVSWLF